MEKQWLNWEEHRDTYGNTVWEAYINVNGQYLKFRIIQSLLNNSIKYVENSDHLLKIDRWTGTVEIWDNIYDAKYDINRYYQTLLEPNDNTRSI